MVDAHGVAAVAGDWSGQRLMSFHRERTIISRAYVGFDGITLLDMCVCRGTSVRLFEEPVNPIERNNDRL
jgi:hypothetical protein